MEAFIYTDLGTVKVSTTEIDKPFKLHSTDIEFIEECVLNDDQKYGEMMAIVSDFNNENIGLIQIEWALKED